MEHHYESVFKHVAYTRLFETMNARYQAMENCGVDVAAHSGGTPKDTKCSLLFNAQWSRERDSDNDELFFNDDDEDDAEVSERARARAHKQTAANWRVYF